MVEGAEYRKEYEAKLASHAQTEYQKHRTEDEHLYAILAQMIHQQLYLSRALFDQSVKSHQTTNEPVAMTIHRETADSPESFVIQPMTLTELLEWSPYEADFFATLRALNPLEKALLVISVERPSDRSTLVYRYVEFHRDMCDMLPAIPLKYVPTISRPVLDLTHNCGFSGCTSLRARMRCARCLTIRYCGQECQRKDWREHKKVCKPFKHSDCGVGFLDPRDGEVFICFNPTGIPK